MFNTTINQSIFILYLVPGVGLEPTRITPADFKSAASACSATPASRGYFTAFGYELQANIGGCLLGKQGLV
jgi:hypothetical protein